MHIFSPFGNITNLNEFIFGNITKLKKFIFGNITKKLYFCGVIKLKVLCLKEE